LLSAFRRLRAAAESQQAQGKQEESEEALTDKMAEFLRKQAEKESGTAPPTLHARLKATCFKANTHHHDHFLLFRKASWVCKTVETILDIESQCSILDMYAELGEYV